MSLNREVAKFKAWASHIAEETRTGEWECDYPEWDALHAAALALLASRAPEKWSRSEVDDMLYAIARDNEFEYLVDRISENPDALLALSADALTSSDHDAKWQLADRLGFLQARFNEAEALLLRFVEDDTEYVSRRALLALGDLKSPKAEALAERAWETGHQYQRIAALWVLESVSSTKLPIYIQKAMEDGRQYVVDNAVQIQDGSPDEA